MIRPLLAADTPAIKAFFAETGVFDENEINCLLEDLIFFVEGRYEGDRILVREEEKPIGMIHYGPLPITDRAWCLYWIGVNPRTQAKGIGSSLVEAMEKDIRSQNGRMIIIETSSRNIYEKTRGFYESQHYKLVTRIPDYYGEGDDKCIFLKKIN